MFYAHFVLAKKGPLARIWLAAHWDKKLTKAHVFETNIEKSVDGILQPKVKMALRTSGHLLLGVVRIYSRKAKYLLADCNEAFVKIKMAFRPGMVDLPEESREAAVNAITLPEVFHDFDTAMPELNDVDIEQQFTLNQSRAEEITLREDYGTMSLSTLDDGFGDMGFGSTSPDMMRSGGLDVPSMDQGTLLFTEDGLDTQIPRMSEPNEPHTMPRSPAQELGPSISLGMEEPMQELGDEVMAGGLFEGELFGEPSITDIPPLEKPEDVAKATTPAADMASGALSDDDFDTFGGPPSVDDRMSDHSRAASALPPAINDSADEHAIQRELEGPEIPLVNEAECEDINPPQVEEQAPVEQTLLLHNEEESFALAPVDATAIKGYTKAKRKRKLIVDEVKNISGEEMKNQLSDTSDIVTTLDLAPPSRRLMHWKETGGVEKLFALPARPIPSRVLFAIYQRHLTSRAIGIEDFGMLGDAEKLGIEQQRDAAPATPAVVEEDSISRRSTRKRKHQTYEEAQSPTPMRPPSVQPPQFDETIPIVNSTIAEQSSIVPPQTPLPPEASSLFENEEPPAKIQASELQLEPMSDLSYATQPNETTELQQQQESTTPVPQPDPTPLVDSSLISEPMDVTTSIMAAVPDLHSTPVPDASRIPEFTQPQDQVAQSRLAMNVSMTYPQIPSIPPVSTPFAGMDQRLDQISAAATERYLAQAMNVGIPHLPADQIQEVLEGTTYDQDRQVEEFALPASPTEFDEEQHTDETAEQFEERILNKRAAQLFYLVKNRFNRTDTPFTFADMTYRNHKKQAAQKFYSCLVLKKLQVLEIEQDGPYQNIDITKGEKYENPLI